MFELPSFGQLIQLMFLIALIYWALHIDKEEKHISEQHYKEEKALLEDVMFLTTTRAQFKKHLCTLLDKVAAYKIQSVIITDEKEIPQSVLLPYAEYKILQECYDRQEALELAPLIKEREANCKNTDQMISHEEMMERIQRKRETQKTYQES